MKTETSSTPARTTIIFPPGGGRSLRAFGDEVRIKLDGAQTGGALTVAVGSAPPQHGPPPHIHHGEDEMFLVAEGSHRYMMADGE